MLMQWLTAQSSSWFPPPFRLRSETDPVSRMPDDGRSPEVCNSECNTPSSEPFISLLTGTEILLADKGLEFEPSEEHRGTHVSILELHRGFWLARVRLPYRRREKHCGALGRLQQPRTCSTELRNWLTVWSPQVTQILEDSPTRRYITSLYSISLLSLFKQIRVKGGLWGHLALNVSNVAKQGLGKQVPAATVGRCIFYAVRVV
jgi:hypothetical protein